MTRKCVNLCYCFGISGIRPKDHVNHLYCKICDFSFPASHTLCPCCGEVLHLGYKKIVGPIMTSCSGACKDVIFSGEVETKDKQGMVFWNHCLNCEHSFKIIFEFCPCCGDRLGKIFQQRTTTGSTKQ